MIFSPGDYVSVRVPRIDRSSTDLHRLLCVVEKSGTDHHLYRLRYVSVCVNGNYKFLVRYVERSFNFADLNMVFSRRVLEKVTWSSMKEHCS